ncbi:DUF4249 family protein [candidate division KSB1 bacterium]|nr:DUF4249 family protein [candidate division KSB1 bacterium]
MRLRTLGLRFCRFCAATLIAFIALSMNACEPSLNSNNEPSEALAVNCVLFAGAAEQYLQFTRAVANTSDSLPYIQDAQVEINGAPLLPVSPQELAPQKSFNWVARGLALQCGQACSLRIIYRDRLVRGAAVIPQSLEPVTVSRDTIRWRADNSHSEYALYLNGMRYGSGITPYFVRYYPLRPGKYHVRILAFDHVYSQTPSLSHPSNGLEGAQGFFASACAWEDSVDLK